MSWTTDWLNVWIDKIGADDQGNFLVFSKPVTFSSNGTTRVRLHESERSGAIIFETYADPVTSVEVVTEIPNRPSPLSMTSYGSAEVYLAVSTDRARRFLSAPLHTDIDLRGIRQLELIILAPLPARLRGTRYVYRTNLNGHCVFSVRDGTSYEFGRQREGLSSWWAAALQATYDPNQIVDVPLLSEVSEAKDSADG